MNKNSFMWAQGSNANVQEPFKELAENGWQHRDIPKASNMNWIFKQISDELTTLRKDMESQTSQLGERMELQTAELRKKLESQASDFNKKLSEQNLHIQEHKEMLSNLGTQLGSLDAKHAKLKTNIHKNLVKASQRIVENKGISRQICMTLRNLEANIRAYHPNFPEFPWPLEDEVGPRENNDETLAEEI
jgi:chromosome segregation ATPase